MVLILVDHADLHRSSVGVFLSSSFLDRRTFLCSDTPTNRTVTPSPHFSDFSFPTPSSRIHTTELNSLPTNSRRRWAPTNQTKIKTEQGSIIAELQPTSNPQSLPPTAPPRMPQSKSLFNPTPVQTSTSKRAVKSAATPGEALPKSAWGDRVVELDASQIRAKGFGDQLDFTKMKPISTDQSWVPNWFKNPPPPEENPGQYSARFSIVDEVVRSCLEYESDFEESSEDDEPLLNRVCEYMKGSVEAENGGPILSFSFISGRPSISVSRNLRSDERKLI